MKAKIILGKYLIVNTKENPKTGWGVYIEGNRITEIGPNDVLRRNYPDAEMIDATNQIIMPGFVDSHMHMYGSLVTGRPGNKPRYDMYYSLVDAWWPNVEDLMDHEAIQASTAMATVELIRNGVTTVCDIMEAPYALPGCLELAAEVVDKSGMRAILMFEASERVDAQKGLDGLAENENFIRNHPTGKGRISGMVSVHTTFTCSLPFLKRGADLANKLGTMVHMHICESRYEAIHCLRTYGKYPFEVYDSIGYLGPNVLASQANDVQYREIPLIANKGVKISFQPGGALVGNLVAPVENYLAHGMTVGIGTDPRFRYLEAIRQAMLCPRVRTSDPNIMSTQTVFNMATSGGARAIGLDNLGTLEKGNLADIILMDGNFMLPATESNLLDMILAERDGEHIRSVLIDGEMVMRDRQMLTMDIEEVKSNFHRVVKRLYNFP